MPLRCGIVGLPNVGKSTLFNALTAAGAQVGNFPFTTIEPNVGVAPVMDSRIDRLFEIFHPKKKVFATVEFVDIAGLVAGASKGEGLGNKFLSHIREVDAVLHVLRCFDDPDVTHVSGSADGVRDAGVVETELLLSDLETVEKRVGKAEKLAKAGDAKLKAEAVGLAAIRDALDAGRPARAPGLPDEAIAMLPELHLLTSKPVLYVANVGDKEVGKETAPVAAVRKHAAETGAGMVVLSGKIESEIAELPESDRAAFLSDAGLTEPGIVRLTREAYRLLGLITFLTGGGEDEVRAWPVRRGALAPEAAGKIHSDMEKGFIKADVISFEDISSLGSIAAVKVVGKLRSEGREYEVKDGDMIVFKFAPPNK